MPKVDYSQVPVNASYVLTAEIVEWVKSEKKRLGLKSYSEFVLLELQKLREKQLAEAKR